MNAKRVVRVWEDVHELCANFTLFLVFLHLLGVAVESFLHRENLVKSMIDGNKRMDESFDGSSDEAT